MVTANRHRVATAHPYDRSTQLACARAPVRNEMQQDQSSVSAEPITPLSDWASELAKQLIASKSPPPDELDDAQRLALAWALKDAAIAAWSSVPSDVVVAAEALAALPHATVGTIGAADNEVHAIGNWVDGLADLTLGKMTDAIARLDEATRRFTLLGQPAVGAHAQVSKIMALSFLGRHSDAVACGELARGVLAAAGETHAAAKVDLNLGNLFCQSSDYITALAHFQRAQALFDSVADEERSISCEIGAAEAYSSYGDFDRALPLYKRAEGRAKKGNLPVVRSVAMEAIALMQLARGEYTPALIGLEHSRKLFEQLNLVPHLATAEKQLADAYLELRLLPEALTLFESSLARFSDLEMWAEQAWGLAQYVRTLIAIKNSSVDKLVMLDQAWNLFSSQGIRSGQATVLLIRAEIAFDDKAFNKAALLAADAANAFTSDNLVREEAEANIIRAHALLKSERINDAGDLFSSTLAKAHRLGLLSIEVRGQVGLGLVANHRGESLAATLHFESAISRFEEQRNTLPGDDIRGAFLSDQLRPYEELLRIANDTFDQAPSHDAAARVLIQLERFRARVLGERLGEPKRRVADVQDDDSEQKLRTRLSWLYRRRQKLIDDGDDSQSVSLEARQVEHELLERARRRRLTGNADALSTDTGAFDPAVLQVALGEGEVLIEYGVMDDELFACVVTRDRVALQRRMAHWPEVVEAMRTARFQIETLRYGAGAVDRHIELLTRRSKAAMRRVHDLVWAPIRPLLMGHTKALVVAHDQLGSLQFAALYDGENYLAQTMNLAMAPSARVALYGMAHQPVAATRALVLGESSRLAHAADEANFVAGLFDEASILTGDEANAVALRAACADADVLHLACHAEFRSDNPMFSALQLSDGAFTVQDAETLQLRQGIVVLSACETGVAVYSRGDEMIGLVRTFLLAGASRVVASLWPVDDAVTMQFMEAFYRSLRGGNAPSVALRAAQLDVMTTHPHPFHWAAFTLYGGW